MKDFYSVMEKGEVGAADYYEKKRETVLETIAPICEAFGITEYDYKIVGQLEVLWVEGTGIDCTRNSIAATVKSLVHHIASRL